MTNIIKPFNEDRDRSYTIDREDDFFKYSHLLSSTRGEEFTICGVACEEWNYDGYKEDTKITCPNCIMIIKYCNSFMDKVDNGKS